MATSPHLVGLLVGDDPAGWDALGFPVTGDRCTVGGVTVRFAGSAGPRGILGWQLDPAAGGEVDGLAEVDATGTDDPAERASAGADPATDRGYAISAVDHLVVATPDVERTTAALERVGLVPRRTVDAARGDAGVRYRFFLLGTCVLEVIGPTEVTEEGPARFVGLAFTAPDLDAVEHTTGPPRDAVQPGRRIVTLRTRDHDVSVPLAVLSPRQAAAHS